MKLFIQRKVGMVSCQAVKAEHLKHCMYYVGRIGQLW